MSSFEFLSVLISVVVGLAIANILTGIGRLIHRGSDVQLSVNFVAWMLFVSFYLVQMVVWACGGVIAWSSRNERVHDLIATIVLMSQIGWVSYQLSDLEWFLAR